MDQVEQDEEQEIMQHLPKWMQTLKEIVEETESEQGGRH